MKYNEEKMTIANRLNPWPRIGIIVALVVAGFWFFGNWQYGLLNGFRGLWTMGRGGYGGHMMGYGSGYGMGIGMLLFWGLIVFLIVSLVTGSLSRTKQSDAPAGQSEDALEILKKRYARGEIDKAEFDTLRHDLNV